MDYKEALNYIHNTNKFGIKLGLENMKNLLNILGNPQDKLKFIHIAGTNGKGSISSLFHSVLKIHGYRVGLFTSPYLEEFTERIQINGENIGKEELARITQEVQISIDVLISKGCQHPTEFEIVTAIGLLYFHQKQVDIVILEVGLGGRLDATNIIPKPELSIITSIGMDHTQYLGNSIKEITREKAGIIKKHGKVVVYPQSNEVNEEIIKIANERNAKVFLTDKKNIKALDRSIEGQNFSYVSDKLKLDWVEIKLLGKHQIYNGATVLRGLEVLQDMGFKITTSSILKGFKSATWPGRFELISKKPLVIIDGAHNPQGARAFYNSVREYFPNKKILLAIGLLGDKAVEEILEILLPIAKEVITLTPNNPRAIKADVLADMIKTLDKTIKVTPIKSIKEALEKTNKEEITAFLGSLYLVGDIRRLCNQSKGNA